MMDFIKEGNIIDGNSLKQKYLEGMKRDVDKYIKRGLRPPGIVTILVGDNPASRSYVNLKMKMAEELGYYKVTQKLPENISQEELLKWIDYYNKDEKIDGILVQLPLPMHISKQAVIVRISPDKDVDGFHSSNFAKLVFGVRSFIPCTPLGIIAIFEEIEKKIKVNILRGKRVVILGRSELVGKPLAFLLMQHGIDATVTVVHSKSENIEKICLEADILVAAIGVEGFVKASFVKQGAVVIDVGVNRVVKDGKTYLRGDVDFENVRHKASYITPVPGGVGPMTVTALMKNILESYERITKPVEVRITRPYL